jgi:hypothetical protein
MFAAATNDDLIIVTAPLATGISWTLGFTALGTQGPNNSPSCTG